MPLLADIVDEIERIEGPVFHGEVTSVTGGILETSGMGRRFAVGDKCWADTRDGKRIGCEVVGFRDGRTVLLAFEDVRGVTIGSRVSSRSDSGAARPSVGWLGRVVDAAGRPLDGKGPLPTGPRRALITSPPPAFVRRRVGRKIDTGVRTLDVFTPLCQGQRIGIFAGSGVGKSTLLSMLARNADADAIVIGLVGERGREVREFLEDDLGPEGLARSVVVVATSDESALMRRDAAWMTMAVAEALRDEGKHVVCMMDSVTRFAMACREIGLAAGEPPATKGYTPSTFTELPRLLERAGPGTEGQGDITGIFTVLVEGGDHDEPVADAVRSILDGHVVLDRAIADRGRFPAIDVLRSVSRMLPECHSAEEQQALTRSRRLLAAYENVAELVRIGAYKAGSDPEVDEAVNLNGALDAFMTQAMSETTASEDAFSMLNDILGAS